MNSRFQCPKESQPADRPRNAVCVMFSVALTLAVLVTISPKLKVPPNNLFAYVLVGGSIIAVVICNLAIPIKSPKPSNLVFFFGSGTLCSVIGFSGWLLLQPKSHMAFMGTAWMFVAVFNLCIILAIALTGKTNAQLAEFNVARKVLPPK